MPRASNPRGNFTQPHRAARRRRISKDAMEGGTIQPPRFSVVAFQGTFCVSYGEPLTPNSRDSELIETPFIAVIAEFL
jgi:hypothetical protein